MNGAQALIRTLLKGGVTTSFTNPGTSEMQFVAALDSSPGMKAVLALFEGVATGAADGYARMTGRPAATLLHLGPGLGNGLANLHNARKGKVPVVNIVGDHATYHTKYDAQLQSDIETVARNVSSWVRTSNITAELGRDAGDAISAALGPPGQVATLIVPADVAWGDGGEPAQVIRQKAPSAPSQERLAEVAQSLRTGGGAALLLGGRALRADALKTAARIAARAGTRVFAEVFPTRWERGAGLPAVERLAYVPEFASVQLRGLKHLVLVDAKAPVSFFAYPGRDSDLVPNGCEVHELVSPGADVLDALDGVLAALGPGGADAALRAPSRPAPPTGSLTAEKVCQAIAAALPEGAIISDESQTSGVSLAADTGGAPRHDWLALTGGAIGQGLPVAVGAAVACPDRPVFALEADGSALYTIQSLWTMAREQLDVTVVIFNNRSYAILNLELARVGAKNAGPEVKGQLDLSRPDIDFVQLGSSFGVPSRRVENAEELVGAIEHAVAEPGPHLIEVRVPSTLTAAQLRVMPYALRALGALPGPLAARVKDRFYP